MTKTILFALSLAVLPSMASAQPGSGTDFHSVSREVDEMMRDGRWQRLLDESQASRQAAERSRQSGAPPSAYTSTTTTPPRRR